MNTKQISFFKHYKDFIKKVLFTLAMLAIYKIISFIVLPGIDVEIMKTAISSKSIVNSIFKSFDLYLGGNLEKCSILSLNVMPYISASIIIQLLSSKIGGLDIFIKLKEEGELGRQKITEYTQYLALIISMCHAIFYCTYTSYQVFDGIRAVFINRFIFILIGTTSLVTGTMFTIWLSGQIQNHGIGNGTSTILLTNILSKLPLNINQFLNLYMAHKISSLWFFGGIIILFFVLLFIIYGENTIYPIAIKYPMHYRTNTHHILPMRLNNAGILPSMVVSSISYFPSIVMYFLYSFDSELGGIKKLVEYIQEGTFLFYIIQIVLIMYFTFIFSEMTFNPEENAKNLNENGGLLINCRPGKHTADYFARILSRIDWVAGLYLSCICIFFNIIGNKFNLNISGTSILITITTLQDILRQCLGYFLTKQHKNVMNNMMV